MDRNVRYRTDATNTHVGGSMKKDSEISHFVTNRTVRRSSVQEDPSETKKSGQCETTRTLFVRTVSGYDTVGRKTTRWMIINT